MTNFIEALPCAARLIVSVAWVAHIIIYLLIDPPLSPFLNEVFIKLDDIWGTSESIFFRVLLNDIIFICLFFSTRSFGHCSVCILLLLPPACSHCGGNDAWPEISLHNNSSHEVKNFLVTFIYFVFIYNLVADILFLLVFRWGATLMNSFLFNVGLILLSSIRLASLFLYIFNYIKGKATVMVCLKCQIQSDTF